MRNWGGGRFASLLYLRSLSFIALFGCKWTSFCLSPSPRKLCLQPLPQEIAFSLHYSVSFKQEIFGVQATYNKLLGAKVSGGCCWFFLFCFLAAKVNRCADTIPQTHFPQSIFFKEEGGAKWSRFAPSCEGSTRTLIYMWLIFKVNFCVCLHTQLFKE